MYLEELDNNNGDHKVQQPQSRQEESPGVSVGGGGGMVPAYPSMVKDPSNSVQDILKGISNSELDEPKEMLIMYM